jgi:5,10-methylenetetrahydrofolate reductase
MSKLKGSFEAGTFVLTGEIAPPKGVNMGKVIDEVERYLSDNVCAVNVTDNQSAVMRLSSLGACRLLKDKGIEPVYQAICRDRNRLALQSDLLSAWALGVENVVCITGDHTSLGDHAEARPVFDLDSVQLVKAASRMNEGYDLSSHELEGKPDFFIGAVVTPEFEPMDLQILKMKKKIDAGAKFFQTQAVYNPDKFEEFMDKVANFNVSVLAGIVVLKSAGMAKFMNENVAGVSVPDDIVNEMAETKKEDRKKKAIEISARIINKLKPMCNGVHIMPLGWEDVVPEIIKESGLG